MISVFFFFFFGQSSSTLLKWIKIVLRNGLKQIITILSAGETSAHISPRRRVTAVKSVKLHQPENECNTISIAKTENSYPIEDFSEL